MEKEKNQKNENEKGEKITKEEAEKELEDFISTTNSNKDGNPEKETVNKIEMGDVEAQLSEALGKDASVKKATPLEKSKIHTEKSTISEDGVSQEEISSNKTQAQIEETPPPNEVEKKKESIIKKIKNKGIKGIRTYKNDLSKVVKSRKASVSSIMASEIERGEKENSDPQPTPQKDKKSLFPVFAGVFLIILLLGGGYFFIFKNGDNDNSNNSTQNIYIPKIINTDYNTEFSIENKNASEIKKGLTKLIRRSDLPVGKITHFFLTKNVLVDTEMAISKKVINSKTFLESINSGAPSSFIRSLENVFMLGVHSFNYNQPFLIFEISSFQNAFSGMLKWEDYIDQDLSPIFGPELNENFKNSTTTKNAGKFGDFVIENQDVRLLKDESGEPKILYSFPTQEFLIITTNKNTLREILTRLRNRTIVR